MEKKLSHTDEHGKARMVDVGGKPEIYREATATGFIRLDPTTLQLIVANNMKKGDVLAVAEIAGIQAAKRTAELIPLCHPLILEQVEVNAHPEEAGVRISATVRCTGRTGVEMEALTAVSTGLLTVYDMCKAVDKTMVITDIILKEKKKGNPE